MGLRRPSCVSVVFFLCPFQSLPPVTSTCLPSSPSSGFYLLLWDGGIRLLDCQLVEGCLVGFHGALLISCFFSLRAVVLDGVSTFLGFPLKCMVMFAHAIDRKKLRLFYCPSVLVVLLPALRRFITLCIKGLLDCLCLCFWVALKSVVNAY
ncbi:hypothetical protein EXN66_Car001156 [Channa argus]|uniref:Uncharacterized protein n=1 Tax=Channa argus TaxID=215402 RepID=A0A6G1R068_CHAAH|nr:hypothetical protein EXN66_Car001156 [Channa argus]